MQLCEGFEKAINSIHARGGWDIYLTGSNAFLLSSDLATLFTGRHGEVHVLPPQLRRIPLLLRRAGAVDDDFDGFVRRGGLAGPCERDDVAGSHGYIRDVYRTILTRDLVQRFSLPDSTVLERLAEHVMDNSGNLDSPNSIADVLDANRVPTNHVAVGRHLSHLRDAFVFYEARRYDIKGRRCLSTRAKHYVCDSGMRCAVLGTRGMGMKLQLAVALSHGAELLVLDEATAGLDPIARDEALDMLRDFASEPEDASGHAHGVLLSSHITTDLERIADRVVAICFGRILFDVARDDITDRAGITRCSEAQANEVLGCVEGARKLRREFSCDVLVPDRFEFAEAFPDVPCDHASIDDYLHFFLEGEAR